MHSTSRCFTKRSLDSVTKGLVILSQAFLLSACLNSSSSVAKRLNSQGTPASAGNSVQADALAVPTKDDVALVNGVRFSISGYQQIKSQMKKPSQEAVFRVGVSALLFQEDAKSRGILLTLAQTTGLARFTGGDLSELPPNPTMTQYLNAIEPETSRALADRLINRAIVQRNSQILAELQ